MEVHACHPRNGEVGAERPEVQSHLQQHKQAPGQLGLREAPLGGVAAGRIVCVDLKKPSLWVRVRQSAVAAVISRGS